MSRSDELKRQIAQLDQLIRDGVLQGDDAKRERARLEGELVATVTRAGGASAGRGPGKEVQAEPALARPSTQLVSGISAFVLLFGVALYSVLGNLAGLSVGPGEPGAPAAQGAAAQGRHDVGSAEIEGLIGKLAERLKATPDDAEGWRMLARSYTALGRHAEALPAYRKVVELQPKDAPAYADLADAVATAGGRNLDGEPEKLIAKALELDPDEVKALALAGTIAFYRGDASTAARHWERALKNVEPNSPMAQQLQGALDDARQKAGLAAAAPAGPGPRAAPAAPAQAAAPGGTAPAAAAAAIRGRVTLADSLKSQAKPDDLVFVFARPVDGGKAPLAILRKQVKDLPLDFTLDDSLSMNPAMALSTVAQAVVGARIAKSGTAMSTPGDLQGLSGPVKVGTSGVAIEINQTVR